MAYVSRFDVNDTYLEQLKENSYLVQDMQPPTVRRSGILNITNPKERIELATIVARIALEEMSQHRRNTDSGLMKRLRA